jgi:Cdc6-like AAA superfamily ATPase
VSIKHVDESIKQMFSSAKITALSKASVSEQYFMQSVAFLYQQSGIEETTLNRVFEQHALLCKYNYMPPLNRTQLLNVCCSLASTKLILLEPSKNIYLQRVRSNMSVDDIDYALKKK